MNLMRQLDGGFELQVDWRIDAYPGDALEIAFAGGTVNVSGLVRSAIIGTTIETRIPLSCFRDAGGVFNAVGTPLRLTAGKGFAATLRSVRIVAKGSAVACPPISRR